MRILVLILIALTFTTPSATAEVSSTENQSICTASNPPSDIQQQAVDNFLKAVKKECATQNEQTARRGCCSWHGGVCGCSPDGQAVCCDGEYSPSCGC